MNYNNDPQKIEAQARQKVIARSRLWYGFKRLFLQPWTLVFPLLLVVVAILAWRNTDKLPLHSSIPEMELLGQFALSALVVVLSVMLFFGLLTLLGTPRRAKKIDAALVHIGLVDRYGLGPALLHVQPVTGTAVRKMTFYSKGISKESWEEREDDISDILSVHFVERPVYGGRKGNHRNYIVLTVAPGADNQPTAALYEDDEL